MNKFKIFLLVISCVTFTNCFAGGKANQDIHNYVQVLIDDAFKILHDNSLSKDQKVIKSQALMEKNLDVTWMADYSLGRQRKALSPEKLIQFRNIYNKYVVKSYAHKIKTYKGEKITVREVKPVNQDGYAVRTEILSPSKANNIKVDFMVRRKGNGFFVFDVVTEGVSLITAQRSEFNSVVSSQGIDELIKTLEEKSRNPK
ncbi:MAG: hypothetical protein K0R02_1214 [Rickettsiaceae bacterium]|jgi:phospholipid transport system substrate-binding protein|nr:hypothetical protein [Rickettsiaceae bacterium]